MKGSSYINPYNDHKSSDCRGVEHGSGLPAKYGTKRGTFTEVYQLQNPMMKKKPPRKMN